MSVFPSKKDVLDAVRNSSCYRMDDLIGGKCVLVGNKVLQYPGGYASVFPFIKSDGQKIAIRCWTADIGEPEKRISAIKIYLASMSSPYFVNFKFVEQAILINGAYHPVMTMDWVDGPTLKEYIGLNLSNKALLLDLAEKFRKMVAYFHQHSIAHGDFQHGNIKVKGDGNLIVLDYDSMYVKALHGMPDLIKGLAEYQHPARKKNELIHPQLDYFSEYVIYLSLLVYAYYPDLWQENTEWLIFTQEDFQNPDTSPIFQKLTASSYSFISDLASKVKKSLALNDIKMLVPLEKLISDDLSQIAEGIMGKW